MALAVALVAVLAVGAGLVWLARELRSSQVSLGSTLGDLRIATERQLEERDAAVDRRLEALGVTLRIRQAVLLHLGRLRPGNRSAEHSHADRRHGDEQPPPQQTQRAPPSRKTEP